MTSHVSNKGKQMVEYYGYYSNVSRGRRKKQTGDTLIPSILEPERSSREYRKNWAPLIQKIYEITREEGPINSPIAVKQIQKDVG